jgi:hypothetical protein
VARVAQVGQSFIGHLLRQGWSQKGSVRKASDFAEIVSTHLDYVSNRNRVKQRLTPSSDHQTIGPSAYCKFEITSQVDTLPIMAIELQSAYRRSGEAEPAMQITCDANWQHTTSQKLTLVPFGFDPLVSWLRTRALHSECMLLNTSDSCLRRSLEM